MEEYQFGKHLAFEEVLKNKKYYAKLFSENDESLEHLLTYCFDNNVETYMCGSSDYEWGTFFNLYVPYSNKTLIYSMVASVKDLGDMVIRLGKDSNINSIMVDIRAYYNGRIFEKLYEGVSNLDNAKNVEMDTIKMVELLNQFNNPLYNLYFQTIKINENKCTYEVGADYVFDGKSQGRRQIYVLHNRLDYEQLINMKECFDEETLKRRAEEIDPTNIQKVKKLS